MANTLNPDRLYTVLANIMEKKHDCQLRITVKKPDGSIVGQYGSLARKEG